MIFIPSEIDGRRAVLGHTWLDNQLLLHLKRQQESWARSTDGALPLPLASIPQQLEKVRKLIDDAINGFSPAQLVDRGPLSALDLDARTSIKNAVHIAYLALGVIQPLIEELTGAANQLDEVTTRTRANWQEGPEMRLHLMNELEAAAVRLRYALKELPREVVFP